MINEYDNPNYSGIHILCGSGKMDRLKRMMSISKTEVIESFCEKVIDGFELLSDEDKKLIVENQSKLGKNYFGLVIDYDDNTIRRWDGEYAVLACLKGEEFEEPLSKSLVMILPTEGGKVPQLLTAELFNALLKDNIIRSDSNSVNIIGEREVIE